MTFIEFKKEYCINIQSKKENRIYSIHKNQVHMKDDSNRYYLIASLSGAALVGTDISGSSKPFSRLFAFSANSKRSLLRWVAKEDGEI
jgi:hypothetical protein